MAMRRMRASANRAHRDGDHDEQRGRRGVQRRCGRRWRQDERVEVSERSAAETEEMGQMGSESEASSGAYAQRAGKSARISVGCTMGVAARLAEGALRACGDVEN